MAQPYQPPTSQLSALPQLPAVCYPPPSGGGIYNSQQYGSAPPSLPQPAAASYALPTTGAVYSNQHAGGRPPSAPQPATVPYSSLPTTGTVHYSREHGYGQPQSLSNDATPPAYYSQTGGMNYQQPQPLKLDKMPDPWGLREDSEAGNIRKKRNLRRCGWCLVAFACCIDACWEIC
jgi:hypothetical protein